MFKQRWVRRIALGLGLGVLAGSLAMVLQAARWAPIEFLSQMTNDLLFVTENAPPNEPIVIVAIDEKSLGALGSWPWSRRLFGKAVEMISADGASAIGIDVLFLAPSQADPEGDTIFAESVRRAGNVVVASRALIEREQVEEGILTPTRFDIPLPQLIQAAQEVAHLNVETVHGFVRRYPLVLRTSQDGLGGFSPSFSLALYCLFTAADCEKAELQPSDSLIISNIRMPVNERGMATVNYSVIPGGFSTVSFADLLAGGVPQGFFQGRIALIAPYWLDSKDYFTTPGGTRYGIEIHANALRGMLRNEHLRAFSDGQMQLLVFFLALITALALVHLPFWEGAVLLGAETLGVAFLWATLSEWNVISDLILGIPTASFAIDLPYPMLSVWLAFAAVSLANYYREYRQQRRVRGLFGRFVSKPVMEAILSSEDSSLRNPEGHQQVVTILFADIRGYTTLSERVGAPRVFDLLNEYLAQLTAIIFGQQGTINKFMGDAILALFNAPLPQPDHALRAVRAGYQMQQALLAHKSAHASDSNVTWGIGINTGEAMVGTVGTAERMEYTVIGDAVNVAARLQGVADQGQLLITAATYELVKNAVEARPLPPMPLKGKTEPVAIYEVMRVRDASGTPTLGPSP